MSVKKTSSLDNIFTFKESEKSLKKTPLGILFTMNGFNDLEKKEKMTQSFDIRFKEHDQSIEMNAR